MTFVDQKDLIFFFLLLFNKQIHVKKNKNCNFLFGIYLFAGISFLKNLLVQSKKKKKKLSKPSMKNIEDQLCKYFDVGILVFFFICQKYNLSLYI